MPNTTLPYLSLKNVRLTLNTGVVVDCTEIQIPRTLEFADRTAGGATVKQKVKMEHDCVIKIVGFNSSDLSFGDLVPGARITAFTLLSTAATTPSILQSDFFTLFPVASMMIGNTDTTLGPEPSKWTTEIHCNVLD